MFRRILCLDTATRTGWAFYDGDQGGAIRSSHVMFTSRPMQWGQFLDEAGCWFASKMEDLRPDLVVAEQPHLRGSNTFHLLGMFMLAQMYAYRYGANQLSVHSATLKSHAFGKGADRAAILERAREKMRDAGRTENDIKTHHAKVAMLLAVRSKGYDVRTDDEADAVNMLDYILAQQRRGKL
jgi:hypothetical protein